MKKLFSLKSLAIVLVVLSLFSLSACVEEVPVGPGGSAWIPGHYGPYGNWHPGHWGY